MMELTALIDIDFETHSVTLEVTKPGQLTSEINKAGRPFKISEAYGDYWDHRMAGWIIPEMNKLRASGLYRKQGFNSQTQFEF